MFYNNRRSLFPNMVDFSVISSQSLISIFSIVTTSLKHFFGLRKSCDTTKQFMDDNIYIYIYICVCVCVCVCRRCSSFCQCKFGLKKTNKEECMNWFKFFLCLVCFVLRVYRHVTLMGYLMPKFDFFVNVRNPDYIFNIPLHFY